MLFSDISPFVRYARHLKLSNESKYNEVIAPDARLFYTLQGYGKIKVDHTEYDMAPHSLLLIQAGIPYHIKAPAESAEYIAINFDYTRKAAHRSLPIKPEPTHTFRPDMLIDPCALEEAEALSQVLYLKEAGTIHQKLMSIVDEYTHQLLYHSEKCGHLLAVCIAECLRLSQIGHGSADGTHSDRIISYIRLHYAEELTNLSIGKTFGYHPNYISSLVKRMTGMPLHRYITHLRLMHAAGLLENTGLSVSEVALASGFCDVAYFSAYFKKHFGTPPSQYRMG